MGKPTLRIGDQDFQIGTWGRNPRIKVFGTAGVSFWFDPTEVRYFGSTGISDFDPRTLGLDLGALSKALQEVGSAREQAGESAKSAKVKPIAKATLVDNGDFRYVVALRKVEMLPEAYHLSISSQWASSAHPQVQQFRFGACVDRHGLQQLQELIQKELAK